VRPADLPTAEHYAHGTRARYVTGCRCAPCRESNRLYYHQRQARAKALAAEVSALATPSPQTWTAPDGTKRTRLYARACPGVNGSPCPTSSHLRKDSKGGCCGGCRMKLGGGGLVSAERARVHLLALSAQGVGRDAVAAACDVAVSSVAAIANGTKTQLRADTERRILTVDVGVIADHGLVSARPTWKLIRKLLRGGFTRGVLAQRLGLKTPKLQLRHDQVLARTALAVEKLHAEVLRELATKSAPPAACVQCEFGRQCVGCLFNSDEASDDRRGRRPRKVAA
jgi:hypothetical protein